MGSPGAGAAGSWLGVGIRVLTSLAFPDSLAHTLVQPTQVFELKSKTPPDPGPYAVGGRSRLDVAGEEEKKDAVLAAKAEDEHRKRLNERCLAHQLQCLGVSWEEPWRQ